MSWLSQVQLEVMNFKKLGRDVRLSDRASIYNPELIEIGDCSRIDDFCVISGVIKIGRNVHIAVQCNLAGGSAGINMDDFSGLAYACQVFAQSDDYSGITMTNPTVPSRYKKEFRKAVRIGRHCIVGAASVIMPGVTVADGCAIGAQALVTRSTEPWGIYVGQPARFLKPRKQDLLALERRYLSC